MGRFDALIRARQTGQKYYWDEEDEEKKKTSILPREPAKALPVDEEATKAQEFLAMPWYKQLFTKRVAKELPQVAERTMYGRLPEKIAAGIAPYVVPKEELPSVVEQLVGGVTTPAPPKWKEFLETAGELPALTGGLERTIAAPLERAAVEKGAGVLARPLTTFLPKTVSGILTRPLFKRTAEELPAIAEEALPRRGTMTDIRRVEKGTSVSDFFTKQPDVEIHQVRDLGKDINNKPIKSRLEWNYKTNTGTLYITSKTTEDDLAHEIGHYIDKKLPEEQKNLFLREINKMASKEVLPNERFADAVSQIIRNPEKQRQAPLLSNFVNTFGIRRPTTQITEVAAEVPKRLTPEISTIEANVRSGQEQLKQIIAAEAQAMKEREEMASTGLRMTEEGGYARYTEHSSEYGQYFKEHHHKPPLSFYQKLAERKLESGQGEMQAEYDAVKGFVEAAKKDVSAAMGGTRKELGTVQEAIRPEVTKGIAVKPPKIPPEAPITPKTTPTISKELEPLAEEARKYKSAEDFARKILNVSPEEATDKAIVEEITTQKKILENPHKYLLQTDKNYRKMIEDNEVLNKFLKSGEIDGKKITAKEREQILNVIKKNQDSIRFVIENAKMYARDFIKTFRNKQYFTHRTTSIPELEQFGFKNIGEFYEVATKGISEVKPTPSELERLHKSNPLLFRTAQRSKSVEEFINKMAKGKPETVDTNVLTNFYNKVKGIKEVKPEVSTLKETLPKGMKLEMTTVGTKEDATAWKKFGGQPYAVYEKPEDAFRIGEEIKKLGHKVVYVKHTPSETYYPTYEVYTPELSDLEKNRLMVQLRETKKAVPTTLPSTPTEAIPPTLPPTPAKAIPQTTESLTKKAQQFLEDYTYKQHAELTPEIEAELSKYKPEKPVRLYRAQKIGEGRKPLESWTYSRGMANAMVGIPSEEFGPPKPGMEVISKVIKPEEILVDNSKLPSDMRGQLIENEVIVKGKMTPSAEAIPTAPTRITTGGVKPTEFKPIETPSYSPANINAPEDIENLIARTSEQFQKQRRGTISNEQLKELSYMTGITPEQLTQAKPGSIANAESALAARQIMIDQAKQLTEYARSIRGRPTAEELMTFKKMFLNFKASQMTVAGFRTEAGRLLQSFNLPVMPGENFAIEDLINAVSKIDEKAGADLVAVMGKQGVGNPYLNAIYELSNVPRTLMASADVSAPGRQGIFFIGNKRYWQSFASQFKALVKQGKFDEMQMAITQRPTYNSMLENKLPLTDLGKSITGREEVFRGELATKIPIIGRIVKASNRAYVGFLNQLRADLYDDFVNNGVRLGICDEAGNMTAQGMMEHPNYLRDAAIFIGRGTGRGTLPYGLNRSSVVLSQGFFAPRLTAARLQILNPLYYVNPKVDPIVRKEALKSLLGFAGIALTTLEVAKWAGAKVVDDPRNADFGKIKVGYTRYDITGGYGQPIRIAAQLITGKLISSTTGKEYTLGEGYKPLTRMDILQRFAESKESPLVSFATELLRGETAVGEKPRWPEEIANRFIPMVIQDMTDLYREEGTKGIAKEIPGIFGIGVQTYGDARIDLQRMTDQKNIPGEVVQEFNRLRSVGFSPSTQPLENTASVINFRRQTTPDKYRQFLNEAKAMLPSAYQQRIMSNYLNLTDEEKTSALNSAKNKLITDLLDKYGYKEPGKKKKVKPLKR